MSDERPTEKPAKPLRGETIVGSRDAHDGLSFAVDAINREIMQIYRNGRRDRLSPSDMKALGFYARVLCIISNEERHRAQGDGDELGRMSDEELEKLASEAVTMVKK